ncbi:MAG: hypothetical protein ABW328_18285 [Ilumatobacteraceae bacterium]
MSRAPLLPSPSMLLFRRSMVSGVFGKSRVWKIIGFAILANRIVRRLMGSDPRTVAIERIGPGETLILRGVTGRVPKKR